MFRVIPPPCVRTICLVEAPSNLGLRATAPGAEPAVNQLPAWLKQWGFYAALAPHQVYTVPAPPYSGALDPKSGVRNADAIAQYSQRLAGRVAGLVRRGVFPLVVGGDCSIVLGNMLALRQIGRYGLFFLDGHTDYAWPGLSVTGGAAGMDLALVTGRGPAKLSNLDNLSPYVQPEHVWSVGNRYEAEAYLAAITASSIHYVDLAAVRRQGAQACVAEFLHYIEAAHLDGFWIHLDVDVLADEVMPAVDSRQPGGLSYGELAELLIPLVASPWVTGMDVTILDPQLDPDGVCAQGLITALQPVWEAFRQTCRQQAE